MTNERNINPYYFSLNKRLFDITLSACLLFILSPLLIFLSIFILVSTGWPIIFQQKRFAQNKHIFTMYKFRVMFVGAHKQQYLFRKYNQAPEPMYKNWQDSRYVGIGKLLSKTGLDELPQLINILKGEMSFVGPRPLPIPEAKKLNRSWNFRFTVKPGIFSEWSVAATRHHSLQTWRLLELETLKQGGFVYELKTIFNTIRQIRL